MKELKWNVLLSWLKYYAKDPQRWHEWYQLNRYYAS